MASDHHSTLLNSTDGHVIRRGTYGSEKSNCDCSSITGNPYPIFIYETNFHVNSYFIYS